MIEIIIIVAVVAVMALFAAAAFIAGNMREEDRARYGLAPKHNPYDQRD